MSKFLKLANIILNTNHIHSIAVKPNKYYIRIMTNRLNGGNFSIAGFGLGSITSHNSEIQVCATTQPYDYKIVTEWIAKQ